MNGGFVFRVAGIPVRVLWMFLFVAFLLGYGYRDPVLLVAWMAVLFVSILLHEMGHAMAYRSFGVQPAIELHGFGGSTFGRSLPVGRDLVVSLAGPFTGLAIGLPAWFVLENVPIQSDVAVEVVWMVVWINLFWSLVNLLPMMPLDGGNATNAALSLLFRRDMTRPTRVISVVTCLGAIAFALNADFLYGALLAGWFLFLNIQALRVTPAARFSMPGRPPRPSPRPAPGFTPPLAPDAPGVPGPAAFTAPSSPVSSVGWVQPSLRPPTFADELHKATALIEAGEPEVALIALDRARRLVADAGQQQTVERLDAEIRGRLDAG